eukprot:TRINITY_DN505_c0_g1_i4.p1 TRINITY_DN505_c0_g1~~TRINITY_DN505_c0_g1_i4.p1  ORF type:complete len:130 (-),score=59.13 TRINITY_DN505_c0_g1_i4:82-429(-)
MLRSLVGSEMCIRDRVSTQSTGLSQKPTGSPHQKTWEPTSTFESCGTGSSLMSCDSSCVSVPGSCVSCQPCTCLLYTSDAADEEDSVDLGGRRIIKKKKKKKNKKNKEDISKNNE